uniref:Uncharacterized protein n=1 Tax=Candidatus Kentrum sp. SD TaxID=2126332 RepID=A0A450YFT7_9GAMM|nr:MAG: hypothetical protein BECKSD772F_GA0070984_105820 [Candidatus Kentron sp. SD]VFK46006.1 MAG: hypothetical protein BECKSD772E_GA0070983_106520 [Candidatus Kentron sp. SD]VFK79759.1 MAG: hypothetical protein BECKSD772D_GA0070982_106322 [Candidatus Kentron sp. SD]
MDLADYVQLQGVWSDLSPVEKMKALKEPVPELNPIPQRSRRKALTYLS